MRFKIFISIVMFNISITYADWSCFGGNVQRTGNIEVSAPTNSEYNTLSLNEQMKISSQIVFSENIMFFITAESSKSEMVCYDTENYSNLWRTIIPAIDQSYGSWTTPAVYSNKIIVTVDNSILCLSTDTGSILWSNELLWATINSSPLVFNEKVIIPGFHYFNSTLGIMCFDVNSGSNLWEKEVSTTNGYASCSVAVDANGHAYVAVDNKVIKFDIETSTNFWQKEITQARSLQNLSIAGNTILVIDMDFGASPTNLFAFTLDGELKWEQISDESNVPLAITTNSSGKQIAILSTGDAYDTALTAYEVETGAILWTNTFAGNYSLMPIIANSVVYSAQALYNDFYSMIGMTNLVAVDINSGETIHTFEQLGFPIGVQSNKLYLQNLSEIIVLDVIPEPFCLWILPIFLNMLRRFNR